MPFFSRVFRSRDAAASKRQIKQNGVDQRVAAKPQWADAWLRTEVSPDEVQELLRGCTLELKARGSSNPSSTVKHYHQPSHLCDVIFAVFDRHADTAAN